MARAVWVALSAIRWWHLRSRRRRKLCMLCCVCTIRSCPSFTLLLPKKPPVFATICADVCEPLAYKESSCIARAVLPSPSSIHWCACVNTRTHVEESRARNPVRAHIGRVSSAVVQPPLFRRAAIPLHSSNFLFVPFLSSLSVCFLYSSLFFIFYPSSLFSHSTWVCWNHLVRCV